LNISAVVEKEDSHQWSLFIVFKRGYCGVFRGVAIFPRTDRAEAARQRN